LPLCADAHVCMWVKLLTDLQILSCELHKNAFGGRVPPGPAGKAIAPPPRPPSRSKGDWREGRRKGWKEGEEEGEGREGRE